MLRRVVGLCLRFARVPGPLTARRGLASQADKERERRLRGDASWKRWTGREEWKNWIDWESPFQQQTDLLNRLRHFFFKVDARGRLWRLELGADRTFGEMREPSVVDFFFTHLEPNATGLYTPEFAFVSPRMHELYFCKCDVAPVVFRDVQDGQLVFGATRRVPFDPSSLRVSKDDVLFHPLTTKTGASLLGSFETNTAVQLLRHCEQDQHGCWVLHWDGQRFPIAPLHE